ncbi:hypothetical protein ACLOJK_013013 [Asimina triloba]
MEEEKPKCKCSFLLLLLLYDLCSFCSFIHCHPLYFAYFIFFCPYILTLFSFLSPLLFSTSLLLAALFTIYPHPNTLSTHISNSQCGFFLITFQTALDALLMGVDAAADPNPPERLIEPLASLVAVLESCTEQLLMQQSHDVEKALEWEISASDPTIEVPQEKELAEWVSHLKTEPVSQLPTPTEDAPKSRGLVWQENDQAENESQQVVTLTPESPGFDVEISRNLSQGVGGDVVEVAVENDQEARKSPKEAAFFSCDSFGSGIKTTNLEAAADKHIRIALGNDPEAYESPDATSSSSESYGFDLETESSVSQSLIYKMRGRPAEGGNEIGNIETDSMGSHSQELHGIPDIGPLRFGRFAGGGFRTAVSAPQPYVYKVDGEKFGEDFNGGSENLSRGPSSPDSMWSSPGGGFGSMRREKEWRRTLACKLYEERMTADGADGMDSLWEAYDSDSGKMKADAKEKRGRKEKEKEKMKKTTLEQYKEEEDEYVEDDDDDDEDMNDKLCCLQALRFSTGKMNLGMRKPSLVKISKAFKGMGMLVRGKARSFR